MATFHTLSVSELSPTYANSINTVIRIVGNIPGIIVPLSVGQVTYKYKNSPYVWKHIWCFHSLVLLFSGIIFLIWGDISIQPWNSVRRRPHRIIRPITRPSVMSNIIEVDEEDYSYRQSTQPKRSSFLIKSPFKTTQSRV